MGLFSELKNKLTGHEHEQHITKVSELGRPDWLMIDIVCRNCGWGYVTTFDLSEDEDLAHRMPHTEYLLYKQEFLERRGDKILVRLGRWAECVVNGEILEEQIHIEKQYEVKHVPLRPDAYFIGFEDLKKGNTKKHFLNEFAPYPELINEEIRLRAASKKDADDLVWTNVPFSREVEKDFFKRKKKGENVVLYGSLVIEKMKGGVEYKVYYELLAPNKYAEKPAYEKLVFPDKSEIKISPFISKELEAALKKSKAVWMGKYEFEKKGRIPKYLYLFRVGDSFFDLTEDTAKRIAEKGNITIQTFPFTSSNAKH